MCQFEGMTECRMAVKNPTYCFVILTLLFWSWKFVGLPYIIPERDIGQERLYVYMSFVFNYHINFDISVNIEVVEISSRNLTIGNNSINKWKLNWWWTWKLRMKSVYLPLFLIKTIPWKLDLQDRDKFRRKFFKVFKWMGDIFGNWLVDQLAELYKYLKIIQLQMESWSYIL